MHWTLCELLCETSRELTKLALSSQLTPWSRIVLEELPGLPPGNSPTFYGNRSFLTELMNAATVPYLCQLNPLKSWVEPFCKHPVFELYPSTCGSQDIILGIVSTARAGRLRNRGSILDRGKESSCSSDCPDWVWDPPSLLFNGYQGIFSRG